MKLFAKIFICSMLILSVAVLFSGYLLITHSYQSAIDRETERALAEYQYNKFMLQAGLIEHADSLENGISENDPVLSALAAEMNGPAAFFSPEKALLYSNLPEKPEVFLLDGVTEANIVHRFYTADGKIYLSVGGRLTQGQVSLYLLCAADISPIVLQKASMMQSFRAVYFITMAISTGFILLLSAFLTHPIKKLTKAAARIAAGHYEERLSVRGGDEIGVLSGSFNRMAEAVEDKVSELVANARQKEDFVASFAHELKTPLTSVIGYSDMLYQKSLPPDEVKSAAWYIWNEGMRLESLSLKLMDLIMLNRQDFVLEEMPADELISNITAGLMPLLKGKSVYTHLSVEPVYVKVEYDLFETLLLNLMDNSVKAGCKDIRITGKRTDGCAYHVSVTDNGRGIPPEELTRITEAFYMVDKSRSRKQHGVGLGLALSARIAELHGGSLRFDSDGKTYTTAGFDLICGGGAEDE